MFVRTLALMLATAGLMLPTSTAPASAAPDNFTPKPGPTFNSPVGTSTAQRKIFRRVMRSINSVPKNGEIDIFSWNFLTSEGTDALLRAQRRGVRVRLIMDDRNVTQIDNPPFQRLRRGLRTWNENHPQQRNSWARLCQGTCRSKNGSAHSKFFLFSKVGRAERVVMQGSANFTTASTTNQWNDIYTHTQNRQVWKFYTRIFNQAAKDKPVYPAYADKKLDKFRMIAFPIRGKNAVDPVMQMLNRVTCRGATNTGNGRTKIQIAPDVIRQTRGMNLAKKLRAMWNNGCNIRIGYTVVGITIGRMLREDSGRGPVPMKHLTQDFDGDGEFDNYFHLKSMTIRGNYGGDRSGYALLNGSANWSGLAKVSDENLGIYRNKKRVLRYEKHLDYWYDNFPSGGQSSRTSARRIDDDRLIFGGGKGAVYEDGESVTGGLFDPFATKPQD
jgi:hypothetical protein